VELDANPVIREGEKARRGVGKSSIFIHLYWFPAKLNVVQVATLPIEIKAGWRPAPSLGWLLLPFHQFAPLRESHHARLTKSAKKAM
jgi:hypothetical protein